MTRLEVNAGRVLMKNPVALASGTCGYGEAYADFYDPALLGAVVVKGISLSPRPGNPPPRMTETPSGMLNSIGLENIGLHAFLEEKLPWLRERRVTVVVNIFGETVEEYVELAEKLNEAEGVAGLELNISCPNVKKGGISFGADPEAAAQLTAAVRKASSLPLWVKLTPHAPDIKKTARAVEEAGADALSVTNTFRGMAVDIRERKPVLAAGAGGLSGPAIKPLALYLVREVYKAVSIPVVGVGGIASWEDAVEFLIAGATAIQVGTANFADPLAAVKIIEGIGRYLEENRLSSVSELIGSLQEGPEA